MTRDEVIARFCQLQARVVQARFGYANPNDCFCWQPKKGGATEKGEGSDGT